LNNGVNAQSPNSLEAAFQSLLLDPATSERICRAVLARGDDLSARLLLAGALRLQGDFAGAETISAKLALEMPNWAGAHFEHGMALARLGRHDHALATFDQVGRLGGLPGLWREIGDQHLLRGDRSAAEQAYLRHLDSRALEPGLHEAIAAHRAGNLSAAERAFLLHLKHYPDDVLALRLYAEFCSSLDRYEESEGLLRRCLERAPGFALGRYGLAMVLLHAHAAEAALREAETLVSREPARFEYLSLKADALGRLGEYAAAAACLEGMLALFPNNGAVWSNYGHILRALGRRAECEAAYKKAIALGTQIGEAYWGLANLKTYSFGASDIATMRAQTKAMNPGADRVSLLFALGKALEDEGDHAEAFAAYEAANRERRGALPYDHAEREQAVHDCREVFTRAFFAARRCVGEESPAPIFIVGMPRSGSTLVEQILASHSAVEGTQELIELLMIVRRLGQTGPFPACLEHMPAAQLGDLGREYLARARAFRKTEAPRFIDKMPNNFAQVGFIHLILPNARIIDVRRHPLACGFSNFKQHWATGQAFAYDLADIGKYYRSYVELMAHFDAVLPGRVHRVIYEDLVAAPEAETRRLLEACGLPFEEGCLRFFENDRAVRTPSSEQVRRPVNREGLDSWRPFEPWLDPLKRELGSVLDAYPAAPSF
jgi:tetratricopeptide (TPR) repeat protein